MNERQKRRMYFIVILVGCIAIATGLGLFALRQNINLYYTPQQVFKQRISTEVVFRLGGMVVKGSVRHQPHSEQVSFVLTDFHKKIKVIYDGLLPSLFREGQGIVAQGKLNTAGVFVADQVLAKHDATYKPPEVMSQQ